MSSGNFATCTKMSLIFSSIVLHVPSRSGREPSGEPIFEEEAGTVGGSFSARVPRSSAELHRDFSDHILEDEVDRQEEEQGDQRDGDEEREENGVGEVDQRETHTAHESRRCVEKSKTKQKHDVTKPYTQCVFFYRLKNLSQETENVQHRHSAD